MKVLPREWTRGGLSVSGFLHAFWAQSVWVEVEDPAPNPEARTPVEPMFPLQTGEARCPPAGDSRGCRAQKGNHM